MDLQSIIKETGVFLEHLGLNEEPFGVYYADTLPEKAFGPKTGVPISRELGDKGEIDMEAMFSTFSCVIGNIWLARKKQAAAYVSATEYGCPGGVYYCGMMNPNIRFIEHYVSTGFKGTPVHGERFMPSPEAMQKFLKKVTPPKPSGKYCIFKPLSHFTGGQKPEFVIFFARPEVMTGLFVQTTFTTGDVDCVAIPFGAGCTNIISWPRYYRDKGMEKAVMGGLDPSARKFMKTDEMTFTVPLSLYEKMLNALPESMFNGGKDWQNVRKKIDRSAKVWGEKE